MAEPSIEQFIDNKINQMITAHQQDPDAHDLATLFNRLSEVEGQLGFWKIAGADDFSGANGVLTQTSTGALPYTATIWGMPHLIGEQAKADNNDQRGALVDTAADGQIEAELIPGTGQAALYVRYQDAVNYFLIYRSADHGIFFLKVTNNVFTTVKPAVYIVWTAGERIKVRYVGADFWVYRVAGGVETLIHRASDTHCMTETSHGFRLLGNGAVDNFRILTREAL